MRFRRAGSFGDQANAVVNDLALRADGRTAEVAGRAAAAIAVAVRLLRIPTAVIGLAPWPFIVTTAVLGVRSDGATRTAVLLVAAVMAGVSALFWGRRHRILQAVSEPDKLATELGILVNLTGKVDETRGALAQVVGGGGWRLLGRLRGVWKGTQMTGRWIQGVGDLERARYFAPPKIGTTVTVTVLSLWLVPISMVVALLCLVGTVAGSI